MQHSVLAGDEITGASTFLIEEGLDSGPVYGTVTEQIRPTDTSGDLLTRLAFAGAGLLAATMDGIEDGSLKAVPQPAEGVTLAPKINVEDAHVDWSAPALRVDRLVRACTPAPGAWTVFRGERLKLIHVTPVPERTDLAPGRLSVGKNDVFVGTGSYAVELLWVQAQGKKPMRAADWRAGADRRRRGPRRLTSANAPTRTDVRWDAHVIPHPEHLFRERAVPSSPQALPPAQEGPCARLPSTPRGARARRGDAYANLVLPPLRARHARRATSTPGTRPSPRSWCTGRCAVRGRTTPSSRPASTGRCARSIRPCSTC